MYQTHNGFTFAVISLCVFTFTYIISLSAHALPEDYRARISIIADSTTYNYKTGMNVFEGHVKFDQGTTHLTADRVMTKTNSMHKMQEAIAYGVQGPAHYWTEPKKGDPILTATAVIIKLYPTEANVTLEQNAFVKQGENSFQGQLIHYNMNDQTVTVPASSNGRSVLIYNPDK